MTKYEEWVQALAQSGEGAELQEAWEAAVAEQAVEFASWSWRAETARASMNAWAASVLAECPEWVAAAQGLRFAEAEREIARAHLASMRPELADGGAVTRDLGVVQVTYGKRPVSIGMPAAAAQKLWASDEAKAKELGVERKVGEPPKPTLTVREPQANVDDVLALAASVVASAGVFEPAGETVGEA